MKKLFSIFTRRWFITLLGVTALALIVWFLGPALEFKGRPLLGSALSRFVVIAVLYGLWALRLLTKRIGEKRSNTNLLEGLMRSRAEPKDAPAGAEIAQLQGRFKDALSTLKQARVGGSFGQQYVYQLPWYMFIGPPGSGKTTALRNSGLGFALSGEQSGGDLRGVGGTRNCDWFFTDEAVLLDTAGRYATQDSDQTLDSAEWIGFLALLKKHRRRRPINGVLVTVSVSDLLQLSPMERADHERAIRQRIQELHEHLNVRFPVYMLVTKCDLLQGFVEYFDHLGQDGRRQVWGVTFPESTIDDPSKVLDGFSDDFDALEGNLDTLLAERLQSEPAQDKRTLIFGFPQQFAALKPLLEPFLRNTMQSSRYETNVLLRGVYFMSGTQEGAPLDRLLGHLANEFGLQRSGASRSADRARSYFLEHLLKDVIFEEAGLAGTNLKLERRRRLVGLGAYAALIAALGLGAAAWITSYARNTAFVDDIQQQTRETAETVATLTPDRGEAVDALPALKATRDLWDASARTKEGVPLLMGLGLGQTDKLGGQARETYERLVKEQFLPRVLMALEREVQRPGAQFDERYETLKTYLMIADADHYERDTAQSWIEFLFERNLAGRLSAQMNEELREHLSVLLDAVGSGALAGTIELDQRIVDNARRELANVSRAEHIYSRVKRVRALKDVPPFNPIRAAGNDAPLVLVRKSGKPLSDGVPGMYTRAGYEAFLELSLTMAESLSQEQWVLGESASDMTGAEIAALSEDVGELYAGEYIRTWEAFLGDITVSGFASLPQAVQALNILSNATNSPMVRLLGAVADETALNQPNASLDEAKEKAGEKVAEKVGNALNVGKELIEGLRQGFSADDGSGAQNTKGPGARIQGHFERLIIAVRGRDGAQPTIGEPMNVLTQIWVQMNAMASAPGDDLLKLAGQQSRGLVEQLKLMATREPPPLGGWLAALAGHSSSVVQGGVTSRLQLGWKAKGASACNAMVAGRYPLDPDAAEDLQMEDFARFFGPGGVMENFFKEYVAPHVDTLQTPWRLKATDGGPKISASTLAQFQRADIIRQVFFGDGSKNPQVRFQLKPVSMDPAILTSTLNVEGQAVKYSHGPPRGGPMTWPGQEPGRVSLQISPAAPGGETGIGLDDGPWTWFKMLDRARISPLGSSRFRVLFDIGGRKIEYELRTNSVRNPFSLPELREFRCPQGL